MHVMVDKSVFRWHDPTHPLLESRLVFANTGSIVPNTTTTTGAIIARGTRCPRGCTNAMTRTTTSDDKTVSLALFN